MFAARSGTDIKCESVDPRSASHSKWVGTETRPFMHSNYLVLDPVPPLTTTHTAGRTSAQHATRGEPVYSKPKGLQQEESRPLPRM